MDKVYVAKGDSAYKVTKKLLGMMNFSLSNKKVFIKPNLTTNSPPESGITTDVKVVRAILEKLKNCDVTIGDGGVGDTMGALKDNGYFELANEFGTRVVDLNKDAVIYKKIPKPVYAKELPFAKSALECDYLINVAKLKIHSLATVTLCLKNLFGAIPSRRHKLPLHPFINRAICDFVQVLRSDLNIIDGIVGNETDEVASHPVKSGIIIGGYNPIAVDFVGAKCMGVKPEEVEHLRIAQEIFGKPSIKVIGTQIEEVRKEYKKERQLSTSIRYAGERVMGFFLSKMQRD